MDVDAVVIKDDHLLVPVGPAGDPQQDKSLRIMVPPITIPLQTELT